MEPKNVLRTICSNEGPHAISRVRNIPTSANERTTYSWFDKYGIIYTYNFLKQEDFNIELPDNIDIPISLFNYINNLPIEIKNVNFSVYGSKGFNRLGELISTANLNRKVSVLTIAKDTRNIPNIVKNWPDNIKLKNELAKDSVVSRFDWWCLNLSEEEFNIIRKHCDTNTEERMIKLRKIAKDFYNSLKKAVPDIDHKTALEKTNIVYSWCANNIGYDISATMMENGMRKRKPTHQYADDPIETFNRRKGVCTGRSALMKTLLNNYYMRVPCYTVIGQVPHGEWHNWNEVIIDGKIYYYDLSFGIIGDEKINYNEISQSDYCDCKDIKPTARQPHLAGSREKRIVRQPHHAGPEEQRTVRQPHHASPEEQRKARQPHHAGPREQKKTQQPRYVSTNQPNLSFSHNKGITIISRLKTASTFKVNNIIKKIKKYQGGKK